MTQDDFNKCEKPDPFEITPWSQVEVSRLFFVRRLGQTQSTFVVCIIICSQQGRWMTGWLVKSRHVQLFAESELEKKHLHHSWNVYFLTNDPKFPWSWGCIFFRPDSWHMNVKAAYLSSFQSLNEKNLGILRNCPLLMVCISRKIQHNVTRECEILKGKH